MQKVLLASQATLHSMEQLLPAEISMMARLRPVLFQSTFQVSVQDLTEKLAVHVHSHKVSIDLFQDTLSLR